MKIKAILFFAVFFGLIVFAYYQYESFIYYFPVHRIAQLIIILITVFTLFFPEIIKKLRNGEDYEEIKTYMIEKYKKK
jgi:hypothetical protein